MDKIIVISFDFPPCFAPGAALRTAKLVRYLPEFGWEPIVICRKEAGFATSESPQSPSVDRIPNAFSERISYQIAAWTWAFRLFAPLRALIRRHRPRLIYVSGPPFAPALTAIRAGRQAGIPVIVDFRDAWSLDPHLTGGTIKQTVKRLLCDQVYPNLERRVFDSAAAIVTTTPSTRHAYARRFPQAAGRIHMVPNGYDEEDFAVSVQPPEREKRTLLYCGRFTGVGARSPQLLLEGLREAIAGGANVEMEILGDDSAALHAWIAKLGLADAVRVLPPVAHAEAVRAIRQADILIVYQKPSRNEITPVAGKTLEYLRAGRPILAIVPPGDNAEVVRRHATAFELVTSERPADVAAAIRAIVAKVSDATPAATREEFAATYSRRAIAARIAGIMDTVAAT